MSTNEIKFSIICPTYNNELYIARCINSVLKQQYKCWELIIVDDGSTDNTSSVCKTFLKDYQNIRLISKQNEGPTIARNIGLANSTGDYIVFLDGDDELCSDCLQILASEIAIINPDCIIYKLKAIRSDKEEILWPEKNKTNEIISDNRNIIDYCFFKNVYLSVCEKCFKRDLLLDLFNESNDYLKQYKMNEDFLHSYLALQKCTIVSIIPDVLYLYYKTNPNSTTTHSLSMDDLKGKWQINEYVYDDAFNKYELSLYNTAACDYLCNQLLSYIIDYLVPFEQKNIKAHLRELRCTQIAKKIIDARPRVNGFGKIVYNLFVNNNFTALVFLTKIRNIIK